MGDVSWLNEFIQMPNVELLLSEGIVLTNSYSHVSDTQSRASLFTGKYAWNLGLTSEVPNYDESGEFNVDSPVFYYGFQHTFWMSRHMVWHNFSKAKDTPLP